MHKNSQMPTPKVKSKIRIIHIFAPQIIKTDAANFRELVQRLTGKPTDDDDKGNNTKKSRADDVIIEQEAPRINNNNNNNNNNFHPKNKVKGFHHAQGFSREKIKGEEEIWRDANTGAGFLGGFSEFDDDHDHDHDDHGFVLQDHQVINYDQFPFTGNTNNHMDVFDPESQVA